MLPLVQPLGFVWVVVSGPPGAPLEPVPQGVIHTVTPYWAAALATPSPSPYRMRSIVSPAPFVVDQSVSGSFVGSLRLPPQAEEHPKPLILCWRVDVLIVTSEDCAAPPAQVPDPPSTPTVCTTPPSLCEIPPSSPAPLDAPPLPELPAPELDGPPEVEPLLEPDEPTEPEDVPELDPLELDPLPELEIPPESEAPTSPCGELPAVEL